MVGNLVDNAGKWARHGVMIAIEPVVGTSAGGGPSFRVTIDDDGQGLAPELREAAMRRGRRLDETRPGSGLGLSIVVDLAALYGGALKLDASPMADSAPNWSFRPPNEPRRCRAGTARFCLY